MTYMQARLQSTGKYVVDNHNNILNPVSGSRLKRVRITFGWL